MRVRSVCTEKKALIAITGTLGTLASGIRSQGPNFIQQFEPVHIGQKARTIFWSEGRGCQVHFESRRPNDEIIVECDDAGADAVMAEVHAIMETRSAQVFNGQR